MSKRLKYGDKKTGIKVDFLMTHIYSSANTIVLKSFDCVVHFLPTINVRGVADSKPSKQEFV